MKECADDNFNYEENGRKLSKQTENTVGKEEIAHYEQFLLFPRCFQKAYFPGASKGVVAWEWYNSSQIFRFVQTECICRGQKKSDSIFEICSGKYRKHCGKRRKCWLPAFPPFPTMF